MTQALNLALFANNLNTSGATSNAGLQNSAVTVTAGTGMSGGGSVALGSSVTLTNAGVTSVTAGSGISVSASTGGVTISASGGGVSSLNGQTGAITNTTIDNIGSWVGAVVNANAPVGNTGNSNVFGLTSYAMNSTIAGSSLRYGFNTTIGDSNLSGNPAFAFAYVRAIGGRSTVGYAGGGTALSGTWRAMTGCNILTRYDGCADISYANWYQGLWVRIS
jgi:hypothetical protein